MAAVVALPAGHTRRTPHRPATSDWPRSLAGIAYDEDLANRIRSLLAGERGVSEKRMFGGLAFLVNGNMAVSASGQGDLLCRVDPEASPRLQRTSKAVPMVMRGREMPGWLRLDLFDVRTRRQLSSWVTRCVAYARTLPKK